MSNTEMYLEPVKYQEQVDGMDDSCTSFSALTYGVEKGDNKLKSIDKLLECADSYKEAMNLFKNLLELDIKHYQDIKSEWMACDSSKGSHTVFEMLFGKK